MSVTVEQEAYEMPADNKKVMLKIDEVHLHSCGVFSNVYRGILREPEDKADKQVAIKKTWPSKGERNFEFIFLTGRERLKHKNVIQMMYAFSHDYGTKVCESYVFEYMPCTLADLFKSKMPDIDIRLFSWQLFSGLKYLYEHYVIHRDLKPVNILIDPQPGLLRISDFGSAKIHVKNKQGNFYQVTRFYRPPELLMKAVEYDMSVDIWSAGCVIAEMIRRHVVFPGRDSAHQMKLYCRCFGYPSENDLKGMKANDRLDQELYKYTKGHGLHKLLVDGTPEQIAFVKRILVYNPEKRMKAKDILKDEYFKLLFKPGAMRNDMKISDIITAEDIKKATDSDDVSAQRLALLSLVKKPGKDKGIPLCEKSTSYESVVVRKSTVVPKDQHMAQQNKSTENLLSRDDSRDDVRKKKSSDHSVLQRARSSEKVAKKSLMMKTGIF